MLSAETAGAVLRVDLDALVANYRIIQQQVAPAAVAGVVKANGYGLGASIVARTLAQAGCRHFFVAHLGEAETLKPDLSPDAELYILNGLLPGAEMDCAAIGAMPVLNSIDQIARWSAQARRAGRPLPAAIQVDSGMARLGLPPEEVDMLMARPELLDGIDIRLVMSHLACADEPDAACNARQYEAFERLTTHFPGVPRSLDNSGGSFLPRGHYDVVRAGIALYGGAPQGKPNPMQPVVALEAKILQLRTVPAGAGVGYGMSHICPRETQVATIAVGYADGWPRHLSSRGATYIKGVRAPIIGRVSMDSITIDVTDVPDIPLYPGAPVELIGPNQSIDDVAADAGTISYEILTQLGDRYAREYKGGVAAVAGGIAA